MNQSCKGTKRSAEQTLPERTKRALVEYSSSEDEMSQQEVSRKAPAQAWRTTAEPSSDTESEEEDIPSAPVTDSGSHPFGSWRAAEESEEESVEPSDDEEESSNDESWHTAAEEEPWEGEELEETSPHTEEPAPLSLDTLKKALPWAQYQGVEEEPFSAATQQMGGNPLFQFEFLPVSEQQWLKRVQKTVYHTQLRQRRAPLDTDDMGVAIVNALEESTRQHLTNIGAQDEDRVFLALTPNGFEHTYQTTAFTVQEFREGSTRLDTLMRKLAGKLNSNEAFHPDDGFQLDLTLVRPMGQGSGHGKRLNPGRMGYQMSRNAKHSIIEIRNKDELCCARAIVTMKARAEWKVAEKRVQEEERNEVSTLLQKLKAEEEELLTEYNTLRSTKLEKSKTTLQRLLAHRLHQLAGVPNGPCGRDELETFQTYLSAQDPPYQLKVFCDQVKKPFFHGPDKSG